MDGHLDVLDEGGAALVVDGRVAVQAPDVVGVPSAAGTAAGSLAPSLPVHRAAAPSPLLLPGSEGRRLAVATCVRGPTRLHPRFLCWRLSCAKWSRAGVSIKRPPDIG